DNPSGQRSSERLKDPAFLQWMERVAKMPAEEQVEAVVAKLQDLNPKVDGKVMHKTDGKVDTQFEVHHQPLTDTSPVRAFPVVIRLGFQGTNLTDLTPLEGMKISELVCSYSNVTNLSPLRGMPLTGLAADNSPLADLSPLKNVPLKTLWIFNTRV